MINFTSLESVDRITTLAEPVIRNLQITQSYSELSEILKNKLVCNANWCTFAAWASKQAGQTIRKEDLQQMLENLRGNATASVVAQHSPPGAGQASAFQQASGVLKIIWEAVNPAAAFERASQAVAMGNLKVFAEIGHEFARFYRDCLNDPVYDGKRIESFCAQLRSGDPPDGQGYLRQAFMLYYKALYTTDEKVRSELVLLANLKIGFHEQTRLQPEIRAALDAGLVSPSEINRRLVEAIVWKPERWPRLRFLVQRLLGRLKPYEAMIDAYVDELRQGIRQLITDQMMSIKIASINIELGTDLPVGFPPLLQRLENPELLELLSLIDPTPDSSRESGAVDWADLPDRIHFIADLFRGYQLSGIMWESPFTTEQVNELAGGRLPEGRL